jgi:hypothetical protein
MGIEQTAFNNQQSSSDTGVVVGGIFPGRGQRKPLTDIKQLKRCTKPTQPEKPLQNPNTFGLLTIEKEKDSPCDF